MKHCQDCCLFIFLRKMRKNLKFGTPKYRLRYCKVTYRDNNFKILQDRGRFPITLSRSTNYLDQYSIEYISEIKCKTLRKIKREFLFRIYNGRTISSNSIDATDRSVSSCMIFSKFDLKNEKLILTSWTIFWAVSIIQ